MERAEELYHQTDYKASLASIREMPTHTAAVYCLMGRDYFMLGEYKKASEAFEKALAYNLPIRTTLSGWAAASAAGPRLPGRSLLPCMLPRRGNISSVRSRLTRTTGKRMNDLFDYYLEAPGLLRRRI